MEKSKIREAILLINKEIKNILNYKDKVVFGLPGGRSVKTLFDELIKSDVPWHKIHFFMVDERLVTIDDEQSNFKLVKEQLLDKIDIPKENLHPFIVDENKKDYGTIEYLNELNDYGGYDIIVLGVGEDGHVGALYPNYTINNDSEEFIVFHDSPKLPKDRMTASRKMLLKAKLGIVLFIGEGKKQAYENYLDSKLTLNECPAKLVNKIKNKIILTDH